MRRRRHSYFRCKMTEIVENMRCAPLLRFQERCLRRRGSEESEEEGVGSHCGRNCRRLEGEIAMADKSDPRMPSAVRQYVAPLVNPNDLPPDYSSLAAILFGIFGVMMRQKIASWFSLVFIAQSLALMKNPENDLKQIIMALTFAVMGLVTTYFGPTPKAGRT